MKNRIIKSIIPLIAASICGCTTLKETKTAEYSLLRGMNFAQEGAYEEALKEYNCSYKLSPDNPILLKEMAFIYYQFEDYKKAECYWLKALKLSPQDDDIIRNLATLYYRNGQFQKVWSIIDESSNPNLAYYLKIKGLIEYKNGNYDEAERYFKRLGTQDIDSEIYVVHLDITDKLYDSKSYYEELERGRRILESDKIYTLLYAKEMTEKFKQYEKAQQILLKYLFNEGNDREIVKMLSWVYNSSGDTEKAKDVLELL